VIKPEPLLQTAPVLMQQPLSHSPSATTPEIRESLSIATLKTCPRTIKIKKIFGKLFEEGGVAGKERESI